LERSSPFFRNPHWEEQSPSKRVKFHLSDHHTDNFEAQGEPEAIEAPELEEIVDTSNSEYYDTPKNDQESSEDDED
jgi:hypothetical protein